MIWPIIGFIIIIEYMSQTIHNLQNVPQSNFQSNSQQQTSYLPQSPTKLTQAQIASTTIHETESANKPQQQSKLPQQDKCISLDEISQSRKRQIVYAPSNEQGIEMAICHNQSQIDFSIFHDIRNDSVPNKTILLIKRLVNKYWQANRPQIVNDIDKEKTLLFAYLLLTAFQVRMLSIQELINQKEKQIYGLAYSQMRKFIIEVVTKIATQLIEQKADRDSWRLLIDNVQDFTFRREILCCQNIKNAINKLKSKTNNEIKNKDISQLNKNQHSSNQSSLDHSVQKKETGIAQSEFQNINEKLLNSPQIIKQSNDHTYLCQKNDENEQSLHYCQEKVSINNDFSIMTEGGVTDIDISLPFPDDKETDIVDVPK